jgi:hypothetical protein
MSAAKHASILGKRGDDVLNDLSCVGGVGGGRSFLATVLHRAEQPSRALALALYANGLLALREGARRNSSRRSPSTFSSSEQGLSQLSQPLRISPRFPIRDRVTLAPGRAAITFRDVPFPAHRVALPRCSRDRFQNRPILPDRWF